MQSGTGRISRSVNREHLAAMRYNPIGALEILRLGTQNPMTFTQQADLIAETLA